MSQDHAIAMYVTINCISNILMSKYKHTRTQVCLWKISDLSPENTIRVTDTVLAVDQWEDTHLVVGSTSVQVINIDILEKRRTVADDSCEDESLENPPLHLAQYGPTGCLVTANVESNVVKVWPSVLQTAGVVTVPEHRICVGKELDESGCVYR